MKHYFITYQAYNGNNNSIWNQVINISPMLFIKNLTEMEAKCNGKYTNFVVINTCEITQSEYDEYTGKF